MTRLEMAERIFKWEARYDSSGNLKVYILPANDGGGAFEVAGINEKYDHDMAVRLRSLVNQGLSAQAEKEGIEYIAKNTDSVVGWSSVPAIEFYLRDCAFNRGVGGAAKIAQMAAKASPVDGGVGPITRAAIKAAEAHPVLLLARLRAAREKYEDKVAPGRDNFRAGLENRWDNSFVVAVQDISEGRA